MNKKEYQCTYCNQIFMAYEGECGKRCPNCSGAMHYASARKMENTPDAFRDLRVKHKDEVTKDYRNAIKY